MRKENVRNTIKKLGGQPSKVNSINFKQLEQLILAGFDDKQLAKFYEVTERTINNWKKANTKFFQSLKDWKIRADSVVEKSLYQRAKGYQHPEDKIFNDNGQALIVPTIKHYPPDPTSMIFWLKNRQPDKWSDSQKVEHSGNLQVNFLNAAIKRAEDVGDKKQ